MAPAPNQGSSITAIAGSIASIGVWRLLVSPAKPPVTGETDPEFPRVQAVLANAQCAEPWANLALRGDKRFLFSPSGESFLMFGVRGRSWIALGAPVGRRCEKLDVIDLCTRTSGDALFSKCVAHTGRERGQLARTADFERQAMVAA